MSTSHSSRLHKLVQRRPSWTAETSPEALDAEERASFLEWRRKLAELENDELLVLSPFEKNLEVWRQLWRVVERSDVVVQVVDTRNPLFYRCADFENYVNEVDPHKRNILLLNKADLLTVDQRRKWAAWFRERGISFFFWSAFNALEEAEKELDVDSDEFDPGEESEEEETQVRIRGHELLSTEHMVSRLQLLDHMSVLGNEVRAARGQAPGAVVTVGMVGYPNVGKSSTINALLMDKKVGVAERPGKTRHFQTLQLRSDLTLCDCPGLVFPSFSQSKADMYCSGVLPIDNMRDGLGPVQVLCDLIPRRTWRKTYNLHLPEESRADLLEDTGEALRQDEYGELWCSAIEVLHELSLSRGFLIKHGVPDTSRAARMVLKDCVAGKLLFVKPPPGAEICEAGAHMSTAVEEDPENAILKDDVEPEPDVGDYEVLKSIQVNDTLEKALAENIEHMKMLQEIESSQPQTASKYGL